MHAFLSPKFLARELMITTGQLRRIAKAARLPGQTRTKGGQLRFKDCPALRAYIKDRLWNKRASLERTKRKIRGSIRRPPVSRTKAGVYTPHAVSLVFQRAVNQLINRGYPVDEWPEDMRTAWLEQLDPIAAFCASLQAKTRRRRIPRWTYDAPVHNIYAAVDEADRWSIQHKTDDLTQETAESLLIRWQALIAFIATVKAKAGGPVPAR